QKYGRTQASQFVRHDGGRRYHEGADHSSTLSKDDRHKSKCSNREERFEAAFPPDDREDAEINRSNDQHNKNGADDSRDNPENSGYRRIDLLPNSVFLLVGK